MNLLEVLARHHNEWLAMAKKFGAGSFAEDLVQEMYLRLNKYIDDPKRIMHNDTEPNKLFIWVTLRNIVNRYHKTKDIHVYVPDYHQHLNKAETERSESDDLFEEFIDKIWSTAKELYWFDFKMFQLYHTTDLTMRDIQSETTISLRTIFTTLDKAKQYVKENLQEEYEEYLKQIKETE